MTKCNVFFVGIRNILSAVVVILLLQIFIFPIQAQQQILTPQKEIEALKTKADQLEKQNNLLQTQLDETKKFSNELRKDVFLSILGTVTSIAVCIALINFGAQYVLREADRMHVENKLRKSLNKLLKEETKEIDIHLKCLTYEVATLRAERLENIGEYQYPAAIHEYLRAIRILKSLQNSHLDKIPNVYNKENRQNLLRTNFLNANRLAEKLKNSSQKFPSINLSKSQEQKLEEMKNEPDFQGNESGESTIEDIILDLETSSKNKS